jgi:glutamate-5-semialdehyde dehydrogenase
MSLTAASPFQVAQSASISARVLATLPADARNDALLAIYTALSAAKDKILAANARDMKAAATSAENGELSLSVLKRLDLARKGKWEDMLKGILDVRELEDPGKCSLCPS